MIYWKIKTTSLLSSFNLLSLTEYYTTSATETAVLNKLPPPTLITSVYGTNEGNMTL
jgi:hypothetical protein